VNTCFFGRDGYQNCCYKSFNSEEEANTSYLEFTDHADVPVLPMQMVISKKMYLLIIVVVLFVIILFICCISK
jgi:hypothetical protein